MLFANCIPVKGYTRSIICDLQNSQYFFIPNDLYSLLEKFNRKRILDVYSYYGDENRVIIDEYFSFLIEKKLVLYFNSDDEDLFPELELIWDSPSIITNAIIDFDIESNHNFEDIFEQLQELGAHFLMLRSYTRISAEEITKILRFTQNSKFRNIEFFAQYDSQIEIDSVSDILSNNRRVSRIIFSNSPNNRILTHSLTQQIIFTTIPIINENCCGKINHSSFHSNLQLFTESQNFNSCLNRKISINKFGKIMNCPSMAFDFGNIKTKKLKHVLEDNSFKNIWYAKKDDIQTCKICEFRYICTDCRAFLPNEELFSSKPVKCNYDPISTKWQ